MNQNMMMLIILGGKSEKYRGKPEILPNDSSSDVKKKKKKLTFSYAEKIYTAIKVNYLCKVYCNRKAIKL